MLLKILCLEPRQMVLEGILYWRFNKSILLCSTTSYSAVYQLYKIFAFLKQVTGAYRHRRRSVKHSLQPDARPSASSSHRLQIYTWPSAIATFFSLHCQIFLQRLQKDILSHPPNDSSPRWKRDYGLWQRPSPGLFYGRGCDFDASVSFCWCLWPLQKYFLFARGYLPYPAISPSIFSHSAG